MDNYRDFDIRELRSRFSASDQLSADADLANDLFVAELGYDKQMDAIRYPCRFNGFIAFFCYEGNFEVEVNLRPVEVKSGSVFIYTPGNIVRVSRISMEEKKSVHFIVVAISNDLMTSTRFDFNKLYDESLRIMENPCVEMQEKERELCKKYLDLIMDITSTNLPNIRDSVVSLISSVFYLMGALWTERLALAKQNTAAKSARSRAIFEDFLRLVKESHTREKNLSFYAEKLYLTPKYLSKLVKEVSGRSAHEWIDSFVILEAKNLLKYSNMSIKAVVYELNFPNQTTFFRFFKAHTGMTPTEYRKS